MNISAAACYIGFEQVYTVVLKCGNLEYLGELSKYE